MSRSMMVMTSMLTTMMEMMIKIFQVRHSQPAPEQRPGHGQRGSGGEHDDDDDEDVGDDDDEDNGDVVDFDDGGDDDVKYGDQWR